MSHETHLILKHECKEDDIIVISDAKQWCGDVDQNLEYHKNKMSYQNDIVTTVLKVFKRDTKFSLDFVMQTVFKKIDISKRELVFRTIPNRVHYA